MPIKLNPNKEIVDIIKKGLKKTGGYCPCRTANQGLALFP